MRDDQRDGTTQGPHPRPGGTEDDPYGAEGSRARPDNAYRKPDARDEARHGARRHYDGWDTEPPYGARFDERWAYEPERHAPGPARPAPRAPAAGPGPRKQRGIPDGFLVGLLAFLVGMTVLLWTSAGLAGLFAHGAWPSNVTFGRTPFAMRHLIGSPHDLTGAWPGTPRGELSGYGLFWGLFIGQLMALIVLMVFVLGTLARWRTVRRDRRAAARRHEARRYAPPPRPDGYAHRLDEEYAPPPSRTPQPRTGTEFPVKPPGPRVPASGPSRARVPEPGPWEPAAAKADVTGVEEEARQDAHLRAPLPTARRTLLLGPAQTRRPAAIQAVRDAEGPALVVTSDPTVWSETKDARAKLGPVLLYDPTHRCDTPARMHWSPSAGCDDRDIAAQRATALLTPVRPAAKMDTPMVDTAAVLLRSFLHAAAVDGRQFRHVHRWAQGNQVQDAVRILRTHPKAASGAAGELEAALTAHPERRDIAQELIARGLSALSSIHIRESCTPHRNDSITLDSFVNEGGTLYLLGEAIEDPKSRPEAMPLLTALASSVVERGRRMAERSSSGRLDPPMTLVLDDVAAVAPLPQLPELLSCGADLGMPTLALLRSHEQGRARWPEWPHGDLLV